MKKLSDKDDLLRRILTEHGLEKPDEQFAAHVKNVVVERYRQCEGKGLERNQWPARIVLLTAITWCGILLNQLRSLSIDLLSLTLAVFVVGVWAIIILVRRHQHLGFQD